MPNVPLQLLIAIMRLFPIQHQLVDGTEIGSAISVSR